MQVQQILPAHDLRPYVHSFIVLTGQPSVHQPMNVKVLVDGCPGLMIQRNPGAFFYQRNQLLPAQFLHGVATRYSVKTATSSFFTIGVYFQPNALKRVFGINADELTNQYIDLNLIMKTSLADQVLSQTCTNHQIDILSSFITRQIQLNQKNEDLKVGLALTSLTFDSLALPAIQMQLALSERSLQRLFKTHIGIPPKLYLRINRFQRALKYLREPESYSFSDVAYRCGYADQSHFIREFNEFAGASPKLFLQQAYEQLANFAEWKE